MASTQAKAERKAAALQRISAATGIEQADLHAQAKGDAEMALVITLERLAVSLESVAPALDAKSGKAVIPVENVEQHLEAETGSDVVKTGDDPPTFVETDDTLVSAPIAETRGETERRVPRPKNTR